MALAEAAEVERTTVYRFWGQENLKFESFNSICEALGLDWEDVGAVPAASLPATNGTGVTTDELVRQIRARVKPRIQHDCGTLQMKITGLAEDIETRAIYINTDLVKIAQFEQGYIADEDNLQGQVDTENFDRLGITIPNSYRFSGETVAQHCKRLLISGKPGSGKTTFLHLQALRCCEGTLLPNLVPVFIECKAFAGAAIHPSLQAYLDQYFQDCQVENAARVVGQLLSQGRLLLILDGLDEVQGAEQRRVVGQINDLAARFSQCHFICSCRPPVSLRLNGFEEVRIAEFDRRQVAAFAKKWFEIVQDQDRSNQFIEQLKRHPAMGELARTPLLLTLLCNVFEADGEFPSSRVDVYRRGFEILLDGWDIYRNVERDRGRDFLNSRTKEILLCHLAKTFFIQEKNLFLRRDAELVVEEFFQDKFRLNPIQVDADEIIQDIEIQSGLIVTRASNLCSFSHLTFQEYLTAMYLVREHEYEMLLNHLTDVRWQFVIELVSELLSQVQVKHFLVNFKRTVDRLIPSSATVSEFLVWLEGFVQENLPAVTVEHPYKSTLLRAHYFVLTLENMAVVSSVRTSRRRPLDFPNYMGATSLLGGELLDLHQKFYQVIHASSSQHALVLNTMESIRRMVKRSHPRIEYFVGEWLLQMRQQQAEYRTQADWWLVCHARWQGHVRSLMSTHLGLRCDWQFNQDDLELLRQYYYATKLLADCLNRSRVHPTTYGRVAESLLKSGIEED